MNCAEVRSNLLAYLDGEIDRPGSLSIRHHLAGCEPCRKELAALAASRSAVSQALQGLADGARPSPRAWGQLQTRLSAEPADPPGAAAPRPRERIGLSGPLPSVHRTAGVSIMSKRILIPALTAVIAMCAVVFFMARSATPVSAQQFLARAAAAQTSPVPAGGIEHIRLETYTNIQALPGDQPGTRMDLESFHDPATGKLRLVTIDTGSGRVVDASAYDGTYLYSSKQPAFNPADGALVLYRFPQGRPDVKPDAGTEALDSAKQVFDQFRSNPAVQLQGPLTWPDGRSVYVLRLEQKVKVQVNGQTETPDGATTLAFDALTYEMLESQTFADQNGQEILIISLRYLANEILPASTPVSWDLSDLKGVSIVDDPLGARSDPLPANISQSELSAHTQTYVLRTTPAGYTQDITASPNQPKGQDFAYVISYRSQAGSYFVIQSLGVVPPDYLSGFQDETYTTASGLVLRFEKPMQGPTQEISTALVTAPDGVSFLITSTLPRPQIKQWAEDLIPTVG